MADLDWEIRPEPASLRRAVRHQLRRFDPTIRVVAETFLAASSPIDLLAVGGEGEMISIRIGLEEEDGSALLTRSFADLTWLRPRLADFLKLAPGLDIEPSAEPRAMLFCRSFSPEARAASENFPTRSIELLTYHCFRQQGQLAVLFESCKPALSQRADRGGLENEPRMARPHHDVSLAGAPSPSNFRTGLTDADLRTTSASRTAPSPEEEKALD